MPDTLGPLILDLVSWCVVRPRAYADVLDAWRTSCPRLTVWEEAQARGLVETRPGSEGLEVVATAAGLALVEQRRTVRRPTRIAPPVAALAIST